MIRYVKLVYKTCHYYYVHRRFSKKHSAGCGQAQRKILTHDSVGHGTHQQGLLLEQRPNTVGNKNQQLSCRGLQVVGGMLVRDVREGLELKGGIVAGVE